MLVSSPFSARSTKDVTHSSRHFHSYNKLNDTLACENEYAIKHILKSELGFQGYVLVSESGLPSLH